MKKLKQYFIEFYPMLVVLGSLLLVVMLLSSCKSSQRTIEEQTDEREWELMYERINSYQHEIDSLYQVITTNDSIRDYREKSDSTYTSVYRNDTLIIQDSTSVTMQADGSVTTDRWHNETRTIYFRDTLYRYRDSYNYLNEYHQQQEISNQYERYINQLQDSLVNLRDSISHTTHNEVVVKSTPKVVQYLAIFGASVIIIIIALVIIKFFV